MFPYFNDHDYNTPIPQDPTSHLKKLADVQGIASTKVKYLALGADNGRMALDLLDTAFVRGQWLIFQVLNLMIFRRKGPFYSIHICL